MALLYKPILSYVKALLKNALNEFGFNCKALVNESMASL